MSTAVAPNLTFSISGGRNHFLLRRLHSLTGVLFGGYMIVHLVINATLIQAAAVYQSQVNKIHDLPFLPAIEWSAIFLPILFHAIYGLWITLSGQWNAPSYSYGRNWLYVLQRITAIILIGFIAFHVLALKYGLFNALSSKLAFDPHHAAQSIIRHMSAARFLVTFVYPVGILAACLHLANGLRAAAVTWGLTISARSQGRWAILCVIIFVVSFAAGIAALLACTRPAWHIPDKNPIAAENPSRLAYRQQESNSKGTIMASKKRVIVVGGGLAGLSCTIKLAEEGMDVDLFSMVPVKRSHSVCAQGGINACNSIARQQGYSEWMHFDETVLGGDFLADQPPVLEMCNWAPRIIDLLDRMGVPFNRTPEGQRALRLFGGSLFKRTFFAGATTGQQLLYALDEQTRRWEAAGKVTKYEFWEMLWPVLHDGQCVGIVAQDMRTMQIRAFRADAVVVASGGNGLVYGKSTMSVICTGGAVSRCFQAGANMPIPSSCRSTPPPFPARTSAG